MTCEGSAKPVYPGSPQKDYDQEMPQSHSTGQRMAPRGRGIRIQTNIHEKSKTTRETTSPPFLSDIITKRERTQRNVIKKTGPKL